MPFQVQKQCDPCWSCHTLNLTLMNNTHENNDKWRNLFSKTEELLFMELLVCCKIYFGLLRPYWEKAFVCSLRSGGRILWTFARTWGLEETQSSFQRYSPIMRLGFVGMTQKTSSTHLSGWAHHLHAGEQQDTFTKIWRGAFLCRHSQSSVLGICSRRTRCHPALLHCVSYSQKQTEELNLGDRFLNHENAPGYIFSCF
jgi:hypothetical protein